MDNLEEQKELEKAEEKSFFGIIVHSFFVIPFLIAVFCLLLFTAVHLLTKEEHTVYDFLEDIKTGGSTKRWQAAFELSKILANPKVIPTENRFVEALAQAFRDSSQDDSRVRQYLALAMGRTGNRQFLNVLTENLKKEREENLYAIIYALGMLKDTRASATLYPYLQAHDPRIRSAAVAALGNIGNSDSLAQLKQSLNDSEPNVQWGAALSLAKLGDATGKDIIALLLDRNYLSQFKEVDREEQTQIILMAIEAAGVMDTAELKEKLQKLSRQDLSMKARSAALEILKGKPR